MSKKPDGTKRPRGRPAKPDLAYIGQKYGLCRRTRDLWNALGRERGIEEPPWMGEPEELANWFEKLGKRIPPWLVSHIETPSIPSIESEQSEPVEPLKPGELIEIQRRHVASLARRVDKLTQQIDALPEQAYDRSYKQKDANLKSTKIQLEEQTKRLEEMDRGLVSREEVRDILHAIHSTFSDRIETALLNVKAEAEQAIAMKRWPEFASKFITEHIGQIAKTQI